ncbi:MAG: ribonuclease H-like YkuK family protein [Burkholderiaceae bacterium]
MSGLDLETIKRFIAAQSPSTRIYIGADSSRVLHGNVWMADYTLVVVVHIDGNRGCKLFGETTRERDFDQRADRPQMRLMNEVYKVAELYLRLAEAIEDREVEVHLDLNPDPKSGSSCVVQQAIGYIRGVCNISPRVKPHAFAASCAADRYKELAA